MFPLPGSILRSDSRRPGVRGSSSGVHFLFVALAHLNPAMTESHAAVFGGFSSDIQNGLTDSPAFRAFLTRLRGGLRGLVGE